jgi:hypothetical protein
MPHQLRINLIGHDVSTVQYLGWSGTKNGELLRLAETAGIEVLVTGDQNLTYQQNLSGRSIAIVVLTRQKWAIIQLHLQAVQAAVDHATPSSFQVVQCNRLRES